MPAGGSIIPTTHEQHSERRRQGDNGAVKFALAAAELASSTRCEEVVLLDLRGRSPVTEFFIIATGTSPRQMRTVVDELRDLGDSMGFAPWQMNGYDSARWIVLDCVNVVVHVFDSESRDFYDLELLWGDSPRIDWRKELGLPPALETSRQRTAERFAQGAGRDEMDAEAEDARPEGRDIDEEEGDADVDEEAEVDAPVVMELPDLSTGSNSVEFVEVDPPTKRRQRGRAVYPTPIEQEEEEGQTDRSKPVSELAGAAESLDEDDRQRAAEAEADRDVEGVSKEDLPLSKIRPMPMGGVSAGLSSMDIVDTEEEDPLGNEEEGDRENDHRDEIPEAHELAAKAVRIGHVELTAEEPGQKRRKKSLPTRRAERAPEKAALGPARPGRAKAGAVKPARKGAAAGKKPAAKKVKAGRVKAKAPAKAKGKKGGRKKRK